MSAQVVVERTIQRHGKVTDKGVGAMAAHLRAFFWGIDSSSMKFGISAKHGFIILPAVEIPPTNVGVRKWEPSSLYNVAGLVQNWLDNLTSAQVQSLDPTSPMEGSPLRAQDGFCISFEPLKRGDPPVLRIIPAWV